MILRWWKKRQLKKKQWAEMMYLAKRMDEQVLRDEVKRLIANLPKEYREKL